MFNSNYEYIDKIQKKVKFEETSKTLINKIDKIALQNRLEIFLKEKVTGNLQLRNREIDINGNNKSDQQNKNLGQKYIKWQMILARIYKYQKNRNNEETSDFIYTFIQISQKFDRDWNLDYVNSSQIQQFYQFAQYSIFLRYKNRKNLDIISKYIIQFILLILKFYIYSMATDLMEIHYQDLLILFKQKDMQKPLKLCLSYLNHEITFDQITETYMPKNEWMKLQVILKKYYDVNQNYYKSHQMIYKEYVNEQNCFDSCCTEWFNNPISTKKEFKTMVQRVQNIEEPSLQVHMQNFQTSTYFLKIQKKLDQNGLQMSECIDDIYNTIILYPFFNF